MRILKFLVVSVIAFGLVACASSPTREPMSTREFIVKASSGDQFEIATSQMALARSHDENVRQLAQTMIIDHTNNSRAMSTVLTNIGMATPSPALMRSHQRQFNKLNKSNNFDQTYLNMQAAAHRDAIALYKDYGREGYYSDLRDFANRTLPLLEEHYQMVQDAQ